VQRVIAFKRDYDLTISVPTVLREMLRDGIGQRGRDTLLITCHLVVIGGAQGHNVMIRRELSTARELADVVLGLSLQRVGNLLGDDSSAEQPGEGVSDEALKSPVKALDAAHRLALLHTFSSTT
jgi:hypothetical protein